MSAVTSIAWCDSSWNPWRGCTKVSPGCANCYAETLSHRNPKVLGRWGLGKPRVRAAPATFNDPIKWSKNPWVCDDCGTPLTQRADAFDCKCGAAGAIGKLHQRRVFSLSLGDWWDLEVDSSLRGDALNVIWQTPNLDHLMLTKRPENIMPCLTGVIDRFPVEPDWPMEFINWVQAWIDGWPPANVWLGVSVENQATAHARIPKLLETPAAVRFISYEPALEGVDFTWALKCGRDHNRDGNCDHHPKGCPNISWIIVGGESGPDARPFDIGWAEWTVRQCKAAGVACFVKQMGSRVLVPCLEGWQPCKRLDEHTPRPDGLYTVRLRNHKGGDPAEWREDLRVREFPWNRRDSEDTRDAYPTADKAGRV